MRPDACPLLALIPPGASQEPSPHPHHDRLQTGLQARGRQSWELEQPLSCKRQPPGPHQVVTGRLEGIGPAHIQGSGAKRLEHSDVVETLGLQERKTHS